MLTSQRTEQHAKEALSILADLHDSNAQPRDMSAQQIAEVRDYLNSDLFAFAWLIFGYKDLDPKLHGEIAHLIQSWGTTEQLRRIIIQIPRGHLKTSLCTIANSLWQVCRDPNHTVAIFNEKEENAAKWIRAIKDVVQSSTFFHTIYKDLLPPGIAKGDDRTMPRWWKWSDTELLFHRSIAGIPEASITALGIGSASAGGHWNKIIKDDIISEDAAHQPATMERAKDWIDNSYYLEKPAIGGMDLIACTPWGYRDVYAYALGRYNYTLYRRSALEGPDGEPDIFGEPIFPAMFTREKVLGLRNSDQSDFHWYAQMMCRPRPGKETAFQTEWLRYFDLKGDIARIRNEHFDLSINPAKVPEPPTQIVPLHSMTKALIVDPAPSDEAERRKEPGARNAFVMMGHDWWGRRYILEVRATRDNPSEVIDTIIELCKRWECNTVGIEEVVFSMIYRYWLEERSRRMGLYLDCRPLIPGRRDKDKRIKQKIPGLKEAVYYLNHEYRQLFLQEYLEYPYGATRDILDAWAYDEEPGLLPRPNSPEESHLRFGDRDRFDFHSRDPYTGY